MVGDRACNSSINVLGATPPFIPFLVAAGRPRCDQVQPLVAHFLQERGLELSHEKTQITHVEAGFDFLGQNVRRYRCGKVLTKPSSQNVKTFLSKIQETIDRSGSQTAGEMIQRLNQQIKGWTMYHRYAASKRTFTYVAHRIFQMLWRWCRRRHPNKIESGSRRNTFDEKVTATGSSPVYCATTKARSGRFGCRRNETKDGDNPLLLETALEALGVMYFDGFSGALRARFCTDVVEADSNTTDGLPALIVRLWKLHGSVHWAWEDTHVVRLGTPVTSQELAAIYPSDAKYEESRRVPFVVLQIAFWRAMEHPEDTNDRFRIFGWRTNT